MITQGAPCRSGSRLQEEKEEKYEQNSGRVNDITGQMLSTPHTRFWGGARRAGARPQWKRAAVKQIVCKRLLRTVNQAALASGGITPLARGVFTSRANRTTEIRQACREQYPFYKAVMGAFRMPIINRSLPLYRSVWSQYRELLGAILFGSTRSCEATAPQAVTVH